MKKIKIILIFITVFLIGISHADANTVSISRTTVEVGQNVTFSVGINGVGWDVRLRGTGSTTNCSRHIVDDSGTGRAVSRTLSITCRATSTGTITFTASGLVVPASGSNRSVSGTRTVTVIPVRPRSTNNSLSTLSVDGLQLSPAFSSSVQEYQLETEPGATSIRVRATAADNKATVKGAGNVSLEEGQNEVNIVVTAENGSSRTYTINVFVPEKHPIEVKFNGHPLSILRKLPEDIPLFFEPITILLGEEKVEALHNETANITLVHVRGAADNLIFFSIEDGSLRGPFHSIELQDSLIVLIDIDPHVPFPVRGVRFATFKLNGYEYMAMQVKNNNRFFIVEGMDIQTGAIELYHYDHFNKTLSIFDQEGHETLLGGEIDLMLVIYALGGAVVILLLMNILSSSQKARLKRIVKKHFKEDKAEEVKKEIKIKEAPKKEKVKEEPKHEHTKVLDEIDDDFFDEKEKKELSNKKKR